MNQDFHSRHVSEENQISRSERWLHTQIHGSIIGDSQDVSSTYMFICELFFYLL